MLKRKAFHSAGDLDLVSNNLRKKVKINYAEDGDQDDNLIIL